MKTFFGEKEICVGCGYEVDHEIVFEEIEEGHEEIIKICPLCGTASFIGERLWGEEFYY